jgi:hypothetical protein
MKKKNIDWKNTCCLDSGRRYYLVKWKNEEEKH